MNKYNQLPEDTKIISEYNEYQDFFTYCIENAESRQPQYNSDNHMEGHFNLRIFWIKEEKGLGYGIAKDWKNEKIVFYRFGSEDNWNRFKNGFASQFAGDNS
jgi:hypothetical protein